MRKAFEKHHVSYNPPVIKLIPREEHRKIHGNIPVITDLSLKMRQYDKLVQLSVMLKNWKASYEAEFGQNPIDIGLEEVTNKKMKLLKDIKALISSDLEKVRHIRGLGPRYLAGLLAYAHPRRFKTLHRFLMYCGYKGGFSSYSRRVKSIVYQMVTSLIIHRDEKYYPLYLKIKDDLSRKFPEYRKRRIDGMARIRLGTFLLKEIYGIFRGG